MSIAQNILQIKEKIKQITTNEIAIVGVAKNQSTENIREAVEAGISLIANNYVQAGSALVEEVPDLDVQWHFIGHIQSNKIKYLTKYDCIQSIDRLSVATSLNGRLADSGKMMPIFIEINIGKEPQKSGIAPETLESLLKEIKKLSYLKVTGLMAMPPPLEPIEKRRPYFKEMKKLQKKYGLTTLSMGTTDDYLVAIEAGSNMVRLGTCLFGKRIP